MNWTQNILGRHVSPWSGRLTADRYLQITKIFPGSIAAAADLRPGMVAIFREGAREISDWDDLKSRGASGPVTIPFFDRQRGELVTLETMGFPWGMELELPSEQLCMQIRDGLPDRSVMAARILNAEDKDYAGLVAAAGKAVSRPSLLKHGVNAYVALRYLGDKQRRRAFRDRDDPLRAAAALHAVAKGDFSGARRVLPEPSRDLLHSNGTAVAALFLYASAMVAQAEGSSRDGVIAQLLDACYHAPKAARVRRALADLGVAAPVEAAHALRSFPVNYVLPAVDPLKAKPGPDSEYVKLGDELAKLRTDQVAIVILLGDYRSNGPYHQLVENLGHLYPVIGKRVPVVHVVTSEVELRDRSFNELWCEGEAYARSRGVPIRVVTDAQDMVGGALGLTKSPVMFILARDGSILSEGSGSSDEPYWEAFAEVDARQETSSA